ncbi:mechanosensitive ion channel family protein [uncultured Corynebacterium sp.]|uniref:mechanosensitive ion channel family protein n=1 Tax=uncultured Corynebacterium sp. TaxID=159447 RepID=UPI0025ED37AE|nr:mechanosensitive ion channel family protein [uncultured Corynebacterium sp.]
MSISYTNSPTDTLLAAADGGGTDAVDAVTAWWESDTAQAWLVDRPIHVAIVLLVAFVAHWALRHLINRVANQAIKQGLSRVPLPQLGSRSSRSHRQLKNAAAQVEALERAHEDRRVSRIKTLAGVSRSAAGIIVWVWAAITILSEIGVDVTPLIASAGVIGVALGFGAQSLVKDFLSGVFMLLEDQYGIGDTVDLGNGVVGEVEDITLRITTVRDIDGALWYVRNGEILQVANHSDDFAVARIDIPLSLSNDVAAARQVISDSVNAVADSDEVGGLLLDRPNVQGITAMETDHATFRVTIKTLPGSQWAVQRAVQAHVWADMQAHDIETPYPNGIGITDDDDDKN